MRWIKQKEKKGDLMDRERRDVEGETRAREDG